MQSFRGTKERAPISPEMKPSLKGNLRAISTNKPLLLLLASTVLISAVIDSAFAPALARRFASRSLLILSSLISALLFIIGYFVGYASIPVVITLTFLIGLLLGIPLVLRTSMLADTVEYAELKTGKRSEGIIFSTLTFTGKL